MLSAYAALRERQPLASDKITDAEAESDSEVETPLIASEVSSKRKQPAKTTGLPSRKRRRGNQETRYLSEKAIEPNGEAYRAPTRGYSPSTPTSDALKHDVEMRDVNTPLLAEPVSSFAPSLNQNVFFDATDDSTKLYIALRWPDKLSFIGTVSITVLKGSISLFGSILSASSIRYAVYAPQNYPTATLEVIEHSSGSPVKPYIPDFMKGAVAESDAIVMIEDLRSGIQGLRKVCAPHLAIFEAPVGFEFDFRLHEFFPILHGGRSHVPFSMPPSWSSALGDAEIQEECMTAFVKGPKGSGKSMFTRMLVNRLLLRHKHVAYLDCDIGQTEFTPPGMVSLHVLTDSIHGPPFTHPHQPFKAHFVGSTTIRSSAHHYHECISSLLEAYRLDVRHNYELSDDQDSPDEPSHFNEITGIPLVINNFGWNKGLGAEAIQFIESQIELSHVYTFGSPQTNGEPTTGEDITSVNHLPLEQIQLTKPDQGQADRRSLMIMSYFHHRRGAGNRIEWKTDTPLCAQPPWEVAWADALDRIVLVGSGSEDVAASELLRVLNGAIVALVSLDPSAPRQLQDKSPAEVISYTRGASPPPPNSSNCIGLALVRGVRASSGSLHILTPLPLDLLAKARVLVMGEVKLPIWGMLDFRADARSMDQIAGVKLGAVPFLHWSGRPDDAPGSKRLRVRRNLMRKNQSLPHL